MRQVPRTEADSHHWPVLEPLSGSQERPIALNKAVCVAGDRARVNLPLPSDMVSRAHALFLSDEHGVYVRDLASRNHLFINDEPVREAELHDGDRVEIGPYVFRCDAPSDLQSNGAAHAPGSELMTPEGVHVPLKGRSTVIGRRDDCDVIIEGELVSPAHAVVFELDGRHRIRDLRSRHGTFVNDKRIGQSDLSPGDQVKIGDATLVYQAATDLTEASEPAVAPEAPAADQAQEHEPLAAEPEPDLNADDMPAQPDPAPAPEDLDVIPLADDSAELKAVAEEFAQERAGESAPAAADKTPPAQSSESGIIPLLDDSENAPGLMHESHSPAHKAADSDIPIGFALDDDDEPVQSITERPAAQKPGAIPAPPGAKLGKRSKDQDAPRSRPKSALKTRP